MPDRERFMPTACADTARQDPMTGDRYWRCGRVSLLLTAGASRFMLRSSLWLLGVVVAGMLIGTLAMPWSAWWSPNALQRFVLWELRWPRLELGMITGASLAVAGFLLQRLTRVSIAAPSVMGLADGAGLGVVILLVYGANWQGGRWLQVEGMTFAALLGALTVLLVLRALYRWRPDMPRMVFAGLMLAAVCKALISMLLLISTTETATQARIWLVGSLVQATPALNHGLLLAFSLLFGLTLLAYRQLALLQLADGVMQSVGGRPARAQSWLYLLAAGLTAVAVAGAGQVGFVGLVVPHLVRRLCPRGVPAQLCGNALLGAALVVLADLLARRLFSPYELPVGIFTALIGVPWFLWLMVRREGRV